MRDAFSIKNRGKVCLFSEFTFLNRDIFDLFQLLRGSRSLERGIAMEARARQLIAKTPRAGAEGLRGLQLAAGGQLGVWLSRAGAAGGFHFAKGLLTVDCPSG